MIQSYTSQLNSNAWFTGTTAWDPDTANSRLILSEGDTTISLASQAQNVPSNPGRFTSALAALGKQGFSSGRHYWEVCVTELRCYHIGMASESAPRKRISTFTPSKGFWTMALNKEGQYRALDKRPVVLPVSRNPQTLGILLDYSRGQISFYDAGTRSHLYSFVGETFTNRIYPFINYCLDDNSAPIMTVTPESVDWIM